MHERLNLTGRSYALLTSSASARAVVVFVHGFCGCPEKTWVQFQTLADGVTTTMPWWDGYDAFFYSYNSRAQIGPNAASLLDFICNVYPSPNWGALGTDPSLATRKYKELILVGHSEGAVLIRMAILRRAQSFGWGEHGFDGRVTGIRDELREDKILRANLRLFAPAFWGSLISGYKGLLLRTPVLRDLIEPLLHTSAAYKQLSATSPLLMDLRDRTVALADKYPDLRAFRAKNLFGSRDATISAEALATDPPAEYEPEHNHVSICKPTLGYLRPLTFVKDDEYIIAVAS
jgi:hypothetical protein